MEPTANLDHILQKLSVIFGMVALFNVLMQHIYKAGEGNNKRVLSLATRLEGYSAKFSSNDQE